MGSIPSLKSNLDATGLKIVIIASRYNEKVCNGLLQGALSELKAMGLSQDDLKVHRVPGCFELPVAASWFALEDDIDGIICLGAVIRGETDHYNYVCQAVTQGVMEVMMDTQLPIAFGVLTTDNEAQAMARAGDDENNKGLEAARTVVEMILLNKRVGPLLH